MYGINLISMTQVRKESAPTIKVYMLSWADKRSVTVLPDSGAEITAAGTEILDYLDHHPDNFLPSTVIPRAVNGSSIMPIGRIPITIYLQDRQCVRMTYTSCQG